MAGVNLQFQKSQSQDIILVCIVVIISSSLVEKYSGDTAVTTSTATIFIGAFVAGLLLILLSYVLPEFAVGLAAVAVVTVLVSKGQPFWTALDKLIPNSATANANASVTPGSLAQAQADSTAVQNAGTVYTTPAVQTSAQGVLTKLNG